MSPSITKLLDLIETGAVTAQNAPEAVRQAGGTSLCVLEAVRSLAAGGGQSPPGFATQAEAEGGANNTKVMSPLRTAQAITVLTGGQPAPGHLAFVDGMEGDDETAQIGDSGRPFHSAQAAWDALHGGPGTGLVQIISPGSYTLELNSENTGSSEIVVSGLHHRLCELTVRCLCDFTFSSWKGVRLAVDADPPPAATGNPGNNGHALVFFECVGGAISAGGGGGGPGEDGNAGSDDGEGTPADGSMGGNGSVGGNAGSITLYRCVFSSVRTAGGAGGIGGGGGGGGGAGANGGNSGMSGYQGSSGAQGSTFMHHSSVASVMDTLLTMSGSGSYAPPYSGDALSNMSVGYDVG